MTNCSVRRPLAHSRVRSMRPAVIKLGPAVAVVGALPLTYTIGSEPAPLGTGCGLKVPAARLVPPASLPLAGGQR